MTTAKPRSRWRWPATGLPSSVSAPPGNALGRSVTINNVVFKIVGVAAPGFHGIHPGQERELYLPLQAQFQVHRIFPIDPHAKWADPRNYWVEILGRRKSGVSRAHFQNNFNCPQLTHPKRHQLHFHPSRQPHLRPDSKTPSYRFFRGECHVQETSSRRPRPPQRRPHPRSRRRPILPADEDPAA